MTRATLVAARPTPGVGIGRKGHSAEKQAHRGYDDSDSTLHFPPPYSGTPDVQTHVPPCIAPLAAPVTDLIGHLVHSCDGAETGRYRPIASNYRPSHRSAGRSRRASPASTPHGSARRARPAVFEAIGEGDTEGLLRMLAADVVAYGDGGGKAPAFPRPVHGPERVARLLLGPGARGDVSASRRCGSWRSTVSPERCSWTGTGNQCWSSRWASPRASYRPCEPSVTPTSCITWTRRKVMS